MSTTCIIILCMLYYVDLWSIYWKHQETSLMASIHKISECNQIENYNHKYKMQHQKLATFKEGCRQKVVRNNVYMLPFRRPKIIRQSLIGDDCIRSAASNLFRISILPSKLLHVRPSCQQLVNSVLSKNSKAALYEITTKKSLSTRTLSA